MELEQKIQAVELVFQQLDAHINQFQTNTGLGCKVGCGACCSKPDIEATVLEFLPFAYRIYEMGLGDDFTAKLTNLKGERICFLFSSNLLGNGGWCTQYLHRGLICRLFGFSATVNKHGEKKLATCKIIKEEFSVAYESAVNAIINNEDVPVLSNYYYRLYAIDPQLSRDRYPINTAILKALDIAGNYFYYKNQENAG